MPVQGQPGEHTYKTSRQPMHACAVTTSGRKGDTLCYAEGLLDRTRPCERAGDLHWPKTNSCYGT